MLLHHTFHRSCDNTIFNGMNGLLICLLCCFLFSGCSHEAPYRQNAASYASVIVADIDKHIDPAVPNDTAAASSLTYQQACLHAAAVDTTVLGILADIRKSNIDVDEAKTRIWPRLTAQAQAEMPFDGESDDEFDVTGGLYFKYDIWRAVAKPDEVALQKALVEKNLQKLRLHLNGLAGDILRHLTALSLIDYKIEKKQEALALARQGLELVELYVRHNKNEGLDFITWKKTVHTLVGELKKLEQAKREENDNLLSLIGSEVDSPLVISDAESVAAQILNFPTAPLTPASVWERHSEARLAEVEYVAAEVNIKLAEMDRLPKLNAVLGLGSIPLTASDSEASSLAQLSMEIPVWDAGDYERKIARAKIEKNLVRERMQSKAVSLWRRARQAHLLYEDSLEQDDYLKKFHQDSTTLHHSRKMLVAEGKLDSLDLFRDNIELADVAIMEREAALKVREAAANYRFAIGLDIVEDLIPAVEQSLLRTSGRLDDDLADILDVKVMADE